MLRNCARCLTALGHIFISDLLCSAFGTSPAKVVVKGIRTRVVVTEESTKIQFYAKSLDCFLFSLLFCWHKLMLLLFRHLLSIVLSITIFTHCLVMLYDISDVIAIFLSPMPTIRWSSRYCMCILCNRK